MLQLLQTIEATHEIASQKSTTTQKSCSVSHQQELATMMITRTQCSIDCMDVRGQEAQVLVVYPKKGSLQMNLLRLVPLQKLTYLVNTQIRKVDSVVELEVALLSTLQRISMSDP